MSSPVDLTLACGVSDRTAALADGNVRVDGVRLHYLGGGPAQIFWRMIKHREFDASEMSLSAHIMGISSGDWPFVGIPVFPSRLFRHSSIYVKGDSGIAKPQDLKGKRVGVPEYHMTAALFMRGLLSDEYGVHASDIKWVQGGQFKPGRQERMPLQLPGDVDLAVVTDRTLDELILTGELDALACAYVPDSYRQGKVRRLFEPAREVELDYFKRTGIFPIMHLVVMRRDVYLSYPWIARNLTIAFNEAKRLAISALTTPGSLPYSLPFAGYYYADTVRDFGACFWPYGLEKNRAVLEAATRYSYEQSLSHRKLAPDELFAENTLDTPVD